MGVFRRKGLGIFLPVAVLAWFAPNLANASTYTVTEESDWFFTVEEEQEILIFGNSNRSCNQPGTDPFLWVYDSSDALVVQDDDGNHNSESQCVSSKIQRTFVPGTYRIRAGYCCSQQGLGASQSGYTYEIVITNVELDGSSTETTTTTTTTIPEEIPQQGLLYRTFDSMGGQSPALPTEQSQVLSSGTVPAINFNWGGGQVLDSGRSERVIAEFSGWITAPEAQTYSMCASTDDGFIMILDGVESINDWYDSGGGCRQISSVDFSDGQPKEILVYYYENGGGAAVTLFSNSGNEGWQAVPSSWYTNEPVMPTTTTTTTTTTTSTTTTTTTTVPETTTTTTTTIPVWTTTTTPPTTTSPTTTIPPTTSTTSVPSGTTTSTTTTSSTTTTTTSPPPLPETTTTTPPPSSSSTTTVNTLPPPDVTVAATTPAATTSTTSTTTNPTPSSSTSTTTTPPTTSTSSTSTTTTTEPSLPVQGSVEQVLLSKIDDPVVQEIVGSILLSDEITAEVLDEFIQIDFDSLDQETLDAVAIALSEAPDTVKEAFEEEINIFEGGFDEYVPTGSTVPVRTRRVLVVATAALFVLPAPASSGGRR